MGAQRHSSTAPALAAPRTYIRLWVRYRSARVSIVQVCALEVPQVATAAALHGNPALSRERTARADAPSRAGEVLYEGQAKRRVTYRRSGLANAGRGAHSGPPACARARNGTDHPASLGAPRVRNPYRSAAREMRLAEAHPARVRRCRC